MQLDVFGRRECSVLGLVGRTEAADEEAEHQEDLGGPQADVGGVVISHGPHQSAGGRREGAHAEGRCVLAEEEGGGDDDDSELEQAGEDGEVDTADSPSVSPGTDEHEERIE